MPIEKQKEFLRGVLKQITVTEIDKQTASLEIILQRPYVEDVFIRDRTSKKYRYSIQDGKNSTKVEIFSKRGAYKKKGMKRVG